MKFNRYMGPAKFARAKELRRSMTPSERKVWAWIRGGRLDGRKWRRQHPILGYIADFYTCKEMIVLEVDGSVHDKRQRYDAHRDAAMRERGIRVVRVKNAVTKEELINAIR